MTFSDCMTVTKWCVGVSVWDEWVCLCVLNAVADNDTCVPLQKWNVEINCPLVAHLATHNSLLLWNYPPNNSHFPV